MRVRDLPDADFKALMGCSREQFEDFCLRADSHDQMFGCDLPVNLYAFWDVIMDASVEQIRERAATMHRAVDEHGRPRMSWARLP